MGWISRLQKHKEKLQEIEKQEELKRLERTQYFPMRSFEISLDDLELVSIGGGQCLVEWDGEEIGIIDCALTEQEIEEADEISLVLHDGQICVAFVPEEPDETGEEDVEDQDDEDTGIDEDVFGEENEEDEERLIHKESSTISQSESLTEFSPEIEPRTGRPVLRRRRLQNPEEDTSPQ